MLRQYAIYSYKESKDHKILKIKRPHNKDHIISKNIKTKKTKTPKDIAIIAIFIDNIDNIQN